MTDGNVVTGTMLLTVLSSSDVGHVADVRQRVPVLKQRRTDLYLVKELSEQEQRTLHQLLAIILILVVLCCLRLVLQ